MKFTLVRGPHTRLSTSSGVDVTKTGGTKDTAATTPLTGRTTMEDRATGSYNTDPSLNQHPPCCGDAADEGSLDDGDGYTATLRRTSDTTAATGQTSSSSSINIIFLADESCDRRDVANEASTDDAAADVLVLAHEEGQVVVDTSDGGTVAVVPNGETDAVAAAAVVAGTVEEGPPRRNSRLLAVHFGTLEIHEHLIDLGGAVPSCGPPLTLAWEAESHFSVTVEDYEALRPGEPRRGHQLLQTKKQRIDR